VYGIGSLTGLTFAYMVGYFLDVELAERTKIISNSTLLLDKIQFTFSYLFITSIRPLAIAGGDYRIIALQIVPILVLLVITIISYHNGYQRISILALYVFPLISSVSNIVIAENQFEFRTLPGLCFGGLFACLFLIKLQIPKLLIKVSSKAINAMLILLLSVIVANSQWNSYELWAAPANVRQEVIKTNFQNLTENVCLYLPNDSIKPLARLGIYSMRSDLQSTWVTQNIFVFIPSVPRSIETYVVNDRKNCKAKDLIMDFSSLSKLPYRKFVW
jgi:hypothetical protein